LVIWRRTEEITGNVTYDLRAKEEARRNKDYWLLKEARLR
jgi:hypothetical protein